jgi:hypothetical protein
MLDIVRLRARARDYDSRSAGNATTATNIAATSNVPSAGELAED